MLKANVVALGHPSDKPELKKTCDTTAILCSADHSMSSVNWPYVLCGLAYGSAYFCLNGDNEE